MRRKRIKSTGGAVNRTGKSNGVGSTGQSVSETPPATIAEEDEEEIDGNSLAKDAQEPLSSPAKVTLPGPLSPKSTPASDSTRPPDSLASDTLMEIQREQLIKEEFYRKAGIPDQSKVPLYPPVLVRPRTADDPTYDSDSGDDDEEEKDDASVNQVENSSEQAAKEGQSDSEEPWQSNNANGPSTTANSSRQTATEDSKVKDYSGVLNSNERSSSVSQSHTTENGPKSGLDDDDGEYVIVPIQSTTPNSSQQPDGDSITGDEEIPNKRHT
ncbi:hypothetical protein IWQ62_003295 [Dispira parvispora]|uniref:Uncharacterized protein n=1 Tax=Dispira parvispora TaxID=1520584 RepID=A0A9W8E1S9_9FUNG|nr:hypothetical protein IWQ62_003295 [Dispira parvispora]